ncbi:MAG: hypothetical protein WBX11_01185 [Thiobacillaceae bacterium]
MKLIDLKSLSGSFVFLVLSAGVAIALWSMSSNQVNKSRTEKEHIEFALNAARARLLKAGSERHVIEASLTEWQALEKRGFTNNSQRLAWLEAVSDANRHNQLYGLDYTLSSPKQAALKSAYGLPLMQTVIHIKMPILVEDDLSRFLAGLKSHPSGLMRPKSCGISRTGPLPPDMVNRPGLEAECELLWYTLKAGS